MNPDDEADVSEEVVIMTHKLEKAQWRPFLDTVSKLLEAKEAEIESPPSIWATKCRRKGCRSSASPTIPTTTLWKARSMASTT